MKRRKTMVRRNICFTPEHWEKLKARSEKTGAPASALIRKALEAYLAKVKKNGP
jgi:predicted DNA-binding protein